MIKVLLSVTMLFSFSAFAAKTTKVVTKTTTKTVTKTESGDTAVNTNLGWPTAKSDLNESAEQVKAKWNGFTPEKRDEAPVRKTASSKDAVKETKKIKTKTKN